MTKSIDHLID